MSNQIWDLPSAGIQQPPSSASTWKRGDTINMEFEFNTTDDVSVSQIGGNLPPGLSYNPLTNKLTGTVAALPKDVLSYSAIFRAVRVGNESKVFDRTIRFNVSPDDETHNWSVQGPVNPLWTDAFNLGSFNRGTGVSLTLDAHFNNPDNDPLVYEVSGVTGPQGSFAGLPLGLTVDQYGRLVGSPIVTDNEPGVYYFRIFVRDPSDLLTNPRQEGSPRTSEKYFKLTLTPDIVVDARLSDVVRWETPPGSLGSTWETYPSHFAVKAVPQYEVGGNSIEEQFIKYSIIADQSNFPMGLLLDSESGLILGRCPYVRYTRTFTFTVEARVAFRNLATDIVRLSTIASTRTFSITIRNLYSENYISSIYFNVPPDSRKEIAEWVWGTRPELRTSNYLTVLNRDIVYRPADVYFGKKRFFNVLLTSGISSRLSQDFIEHLADYHHPSDLRIGKLGWAKARSPEGIHLYDVIYLEVTDPMAKAGGFNALGREEKMTRPGTTGIEQWNIPDGQNVYYPNSIKNLRNDLILKNDRLDATFTTHSQTAAQRGIGLQGREGLPLWMTSEQIKGNVRSIPGYKCVIELLTVLPDTAEGIIKTLRQAGMEDNLWGRKITLDRYFLQRDYMTSTTFDTGLLLFDGPDLNDTNFPASQPTFEYTEFDLQLQSESKYYKFPPGEI